MVIHPATSREARSALEMARGKRVTLTLSAGTVSDPERVEVLIGEVDVRDSGAIGFRRYRGRNWWNAGSVEQVLRVEFLG